ncbi:MAG TPA: amidohydrolase family protein [Pyrinomonadaceae bacterium]|nr:amidohydrolase family protein [Pyrinomonadaceae bacterium]
MAIDTQTSKSAEIRARLNHPIIDSDGHMIEFEPAILDYLTAVGGSKLSERFKQWGDESLFSWYRLSPEERQEKRATRITWWGIPTKNTRDRATASIPRLLYERLNEFGLDFAVIYPTFGLPVPHIEEDELRRGTCRAFNNYYADTYREFSDRLTPAAIIPMTTPDEAIEELEHAVNNLGLKTIVCAGYVRRPIQSVVQDNPAAARHAFWLDTYGIDSLYNYDPFWAKCVELKVAPSFHSSGMGWGSRNSPSNYMYNHIGMFGAAGEALCKSLFMGGVTRRFPTLKFAFLEGGVGWACSLYADLIGHWEKRNIKSLDNLNPSNLDQKLLLSLYREYGGKMVEGKLAQLEERAGTLSSRREDPAMLDEWAPCQIERREDIRDLFVPSFYFGCEADDPMNAWAFNTKVNPLGARLRVLFGSDIGHWDVPDIAEVVEETYELVEKEVITENDLRDFVFTNPVSFYAGLNSDFFRGTVVEQEVAKLTRSDQRNSS